MLFDTRKPGLPVYFQAREPNSHNLGAKLNFFLMISDEKAFFIYHFEVFIFQISKIS